MKPYHLYKWLCLFCLILFSACTKFVEVEPPKSQLLRKELFSSDKAAETALAGMYAYLRTNSFLTGSIVSSVEYLGLYADEIEYINPTVNDRYFFSNSILNPSINQVYNLWSYSFQAIYLANSILEGVEESTNLSEGIKERLVGEALFVRALIHFYLANTYGNIPYVTTTDYFQTKNQGKITVDEVYTAVLKDLKVAENLLLENYPIAERVRPNKWVVKSFMARVYLYQKDWPNALLQSSEVIGNIALYDIEPVLNKVFLKESKEAIWQFKPSQDGINASEGTFIMVQDPSIAGFVIRDEFLNAHETGDKRLTDWLGLFTIGNNSWHYPYKYKQRNPTGTVSVEYSIVFRLAEQYLIRAEALAQTEQYTDALKDLNKIRNRADLDDFVSSDKEEILDAILKERRIEFFMEMSHRWFDLKRMNRTEEFLSPLKPEWSVNNDLLPIPLKELEANRNLLPQNNGYN
jgi:hypothetical protein